MTQHQTGTGNEEAFLCRKEELAAPLAKLAEPSSCGWEEGGQVD